ncbi:MAG: hypothetical protein CME62_13765 [Halobacteriovoraceae bacterium]|nr:hypothetical protein [Halobacteriovoraceae bacterium]
MRRRIMNTEKNKELFLGRLGKNPELKYTKTQRAVCNLSVALNKNDGETIWKKVKVWGKAAEDCNLYLKKGSQIFVSGKKEESTYYKDSRPIKNIEVIAEHVGFLSF